MKGDYIALAGRLSQMLGDLERVVKRAESLLDKAKRNNDDGYLDGVALNLYGFYAGVERIFEDIARTIDRSVPSGTNWHQDLLLQMSAKINATRPPVISLETRYCLNEYRAFRHVVRNVYTFNLNAHRLEELTSALRPCYNSVTAEVEAFINFLGQLTETEG